MDWKLDSVVVPVTDVGRSKRFYVEQVGFRLDVEPGPRGDAGGAGDAPGSRCSVTIGPVLMQPGSRSEPGARLQLVVCDIEAPARSSWSEGSR